MRYHVSGSAVCWKASISVRDVAECVGLSHVCYFGLLTFFLLGHHPIIISHVLISKETCLPCFQRKYFLMLVLKVKLLTEHHDMKAYRVSGGIGPRIL
jgi:hypothetical protein